MKNTETNTKIVWNTHNASPTIAHKSPLEPGVYHMPAGAVDIEPPTFDLATQGCSWIDDKWIVVDIPVLVEEAKQEPEPEPEPEPIPAIEQLRLQRDALLSETDWWASTDLIISLPRKAYRQALRDLPATVTPDLDEEGNLSGVTFPVKP
jgi:hypothetical protein